MRIRLAIPDEHLSPDALNAALEAITRTNESLLAAGKVPTARDGIRAGVRWRPEPPGDEHFDLSTTVVGRKWGDCDDLAPWHAASLRATGEDPGARAVVRRSGPRKWHALVRRSDGSHDDPSRWAGMGSGVSGPGAVWTPRYQSATRPLRPGLVSPRVAISAVPWRGGWHGRVDVPFGGAALASMAHTRDPRSALLRALYGASVVGEAAGAHPDCVLRCAAMHDALTGEVNPYEMASALEYISPQVAGDVLGFLPALASALPMAGGILSSFGGGGKQPPPGGGGAAAPGYPPFPPGSAGPYNPAAPIIVRF